MTRSRGWSCCVPAGIGALQSSTAGGCGSGWAEGACDCRERGPSVLGVILADAVVWDSAALLPLQLHSTSAGPSLHRHRLKCTDPDRRAGGILRLSPLENGNVGQRHRPRSLGLDVKGAFTHKEAARGTVWAKNTFPLKLRKSDQALLGCSAFRFSGWKGLSPGHPQDGAGGAHVPPWRGSCPACPSPQGLCNGFTVTSTVCSEPSSSL